ncbi:hypothetical protein DRO66_00490 [Candidatus Bathyarchaeota archaeon]|nr:MAG: hypothetical protein DRO66_00490 [Candidatus Bathyarchaeota archaeon]
MVNKITVKSDEYWTLMGFLDGNRKKRLYSFEILEDETIKVSYRPTGFQKFWVLVKGVLSMLCVIVSFPIWMFMFGWVCLSAIAIDVKDRMEERSEIVLKDGTPGWSGGAYKRVYRFIVGKLHEKGSKE